VERIERIASLYPLLMGRMGRLRSLVHEGMDLTYNQYKTLLTIADRRECSLGDLARELGVAMSSASQMVDRLVGEGVVERNLDEANRRQVIIRLTDNGEDLIAKLRQGIIDGYRRVLAKMSDEEQEELVGSFETIARLLGRLT
jgi:DNA-binding MarR family transcriptional regulator